MRKILVVGPLPPPTGGMQTVMEQMMNLEIEGFDLIPFNVSKNNFIKSNIIINVLNFFYRCVKLFIYLIIHNPDIVHIHVAADKDFAQKRIFQNICIAFKKKTVLHMHGSGFKTWFSSLDKKNRQKVKNTLNNANGIIVLSESWKNYYSRISDNKRIFIINNAIERIDFNNYKRVYLKNQKIVLFLSSICERKGAYDLLKTIKNINDENIKFVFVGPYEDKDRFFKEVERLKIQEKCIFVGEVIGKERFKYFASADMFVLPSYAEGLPVAILEAMSFGLPIISTNVGAIPEVIEKENGILIKPGDVVALKRAILRIVKEDKNKYKLNNKKKINEKYTQKTFKKRLMEAYLEI